MKKTLLLARCLLCVTVGFTISCEKDDIRLPYEKPIDPVTNPSGFSRALRIDGTNAKGTIPSNPLSSFRILQAQRSALATQGASLYIPFTFTSTEKVAGVYLQVEGADNYWTVPVKAKQNTGQSHVFEVNLPRNILNGQTQFNYAAYNTSNRTTNVVSTSTEIASGQEVCNSETPYSESGSQGLTVRKLVLGDTPGTITIEYEMYTLPDRLDIKYNDQWVASTASTPLAADGSPPASVCFDGAPGYVPGNGTLSFQYDPKNSKEVLIYMYGCFGQTRWDISVNCPESTCENNNCSESKPSVADITTVVIPAQAPEVWSTGVRVNQGDYVFFGATSYVLVDKGYGTLVKAKGTDTGFDLTKDNGTGAPGVFIYPNSAKKYSNFRFGQLLLHFDGKLIPADNYQLTYTKGSGCSGSELAIDWFPMQGEYGNYFIAQSDGVIEFEINDANPEDNKGDFMVEIFKMTRKEHEERNYCNTCPEKMPERGLHQISGIMSDEAGNKWEFGFKENVLGSSDCFHGGHDIFRGVSDKVKNSQCAYNKSTGKLINNYGDNTMGSYDFASPETREHVIMDVFSHEAFSAVGSKYQPTCNVYK